MAPKQKSKKSKVSYQIPYDSKGRMVTYNHNPDIAEWRDPEEFYDHIIFDCFERGRSAAHAIFRGAEEERWQVFLTDLADMIPHMRDGIVTGTFIPTKRGQNFGIKLAKAD